MAEVYIGGQVTSALMEILETEEILPGKDVGYQACKIIWQYHPLGGKLVEKPIMMAMCKPRRYNVDTDPDERVVRRFEEVWNRLAVSEKIRNLFFLSRCYGAAAIGVGTDGVSCREQIPDFGLKEDDVYINVWDPLNASGSMVTDQNPNSRYFQQANTTLVISGKKWHPSRTAKVFNTTPIYLSFQSSTFGFTGRSVFQRILYPLKSYIGTMTANDMVSKKAAVLVAKVAQNSSVINGIMSMATRKKREDLKAAENNSVLSIGPNDAIESLNLQNIDGALNAARDNIISDIASGSDVPAILIKEEAFSKGWTEGSEDSKAISQYIDGIRQQIEPVMHFLEEIVQYIAWSEDFYESLKADYPDIITEDYKTTFYMWRREFRADWQELVEESPDKRRDSDSKVLREAANTYAILAPQLDPENRAHATEWLASLSNDTETYGDTPLIIDKEALSKYEPPLPQPGERINVGELDEEKEEKE